MCIDRHKLLSSTVSPYATSGGAGQADAVFRIIRMVFNFSIIYYDLKINNPVDAFAVLQIWANLESREDWIPPEYLKAWWRHVHALPAVDRDYFLTLLFTAQRAGEIAELQWQQVDFTNGLLDIPAMQTKDKKRHIIPMSTHLADLLWQRRVITGNTRYVFCDLEQDDRYPEGKRAYEPVAKAINLDWSPHSCRRTWGTYAEELLKIDHDVVRRCLMHSKNDVTSHYVIGQSDTLRQYFQQVSEFVYFVATGEKPRRRLDITLQKRA